ncbi:MAG: GNAT family N-acetyltransferase [Bacteroidia bacterium]|nr:GNAT family N-acetyltransferase [Bacteroidia bacterium]
MSIEVDRIEHLDDKLLEELFSKSSDFKGAFEAEFFQSKDRIFLLARMENKSCGFLFAYLLPDPRKGKKKCFLYSLDTFEEYRRKGVAKKLMEALTQIAREEKCKSIFLLTAHDNFPAQALYESGGAEKNTGEILYVYELGKSD